MSSGFVTEAEINEARKVRQEEWERVRKPDQPIEAPEVPYDGRSLFERLKEQKDKKESEYEETHKLKNMIRGLDDDEVDFLEYVDKTKMNAEMRQQREENKEMEEFRSRVATLQQKSIDDKIQAEISTPKVNPRSSGTTQRPSQKSILKGIVVHKRKSEAELTESASPPPKKGKTPKITTPIMNCIGVLPGISGEYSATDSDDSSESEDDEHAPKYDLCGRRIEHSHCGNE